jgi:hypothetical protein
MSSTCVVRALNIFFSFIFISYHFICIFMWKGTDSRVDKIKYFKELGLWFLPEGVEECENAARLRYMVKRGEDILQRCCTEGNYWANMPQEKKNALFAKGR